MDSTPTAEIIIEELNVATNPVSHPIESFTTPEYPPTIILKGVVMVFVPAGRFLMGSEDGDEDEKPVHGIYLDDFFIGKYEVSNILYKECVDEGGCQRQIVHG